MSTEFVTGKPIRPDQVGAAQQTVIPAVVFDAFNAEIAKAFDGLAAVVKQDRVVSAIVTAGIDRQTIFDNGYLNVEPAYRDAGWSVAYDKPGFNESYPATFTFSRKAQS